ncbi:MAG TPA: hypothetical protein P5531_14040 [Bacteroidales bacterium]|nr:hypothetical protein [Bacteroidales bacterium]HSA44731.1 hypothetical protein [Bacteroidales bacterium]
MKSLKYLSLALIVGLSACRPELDEFSPSAGQLDLTNYVAVGCGSTAGFADGELYRSGQVNSFPNMLAGQFSLAGGGNFRQPLMTDELGFGNKRIMGYYTDCLGAVQLMPVLAGGVPSPANFTSIASQGPFHNLGVPLTRSFMVPLAGYAQANPYFGRFASSVVASLLAEAVAADPSFFTIWLGSSDVLGYAMAGGDNTPDSLTPVHVFNLSMQAIVGGMISTGGRGAILTVPDITAFPYFTAVPVKGLTLDDAKVQLLNQAYAGYNQMASALGLPQMQFNTGSNYWIVQDPDPAYVQLGGIRQAVAGELITLSIPQDSLKCGGWGSQKPIPHKYLIDLKEIQKIKDATQQYNGILGGLAQENNLLLIDMHLFFKGVYAGLVADGLKFSNTFVSGGFFSLDGIHLSARGNALVSNYIIESLNKTYQSRIPLVNVGDYPGIGFP